MKKSGHSPLIVGAWGRGAVGGAGSLLPGRGTEGGAMTPENFHRWGLFRPFFGPWREGDGEALRLLGGEGFDGDLVLGISCRCAFGVPQVIGCAPLRRGRPFPTNWWLVCPFLREACAREEERGGVRSLEDHLKPWAKEWREYARRHARWRLACLSPSTMRFLYRRRPGFWRALEGTGPGGIVPTETPRVKCLHLQLASWMVWPDHPGASWLAEKFPRLRCDAPQGCIAGRGENDG